MSPQTLTRHVCHVRDFADNAAYTQFIVTPRNEKSFLPLTYQPDHWARHGWPYDATDEASRWQPPVSRELRAGEWFAAGNLASVDAKPAISTPDPQSGPIVQNHSWNCLVS